MEKSKNERLGDEAPAVKDYLIVIVAVTLLILFSRAAWTFGWFH